MKRKASRDRRPVLEELEAQVLYSADALGGLDAVLVANKDESVLEATLLESHNNHAEVSAAQVAVSSEQLEQVRHEIVFVDTDTDNYQQLVDDLTRNSDGTRQFDVYLLDNSRDGIEQINSVLAGYTGLDAMHIIAHGDDGVLDLGGSQLDRTGLNEHATQIAGWADAFSEGGDLLIYGCDLAATVDGQALVDSLATLTGTDVAASNDLTGSAALGGDWELEYSVGKVESHVALSQQAQQSYIGVLSLTTEGSETRVNTSTTGDQILTPYGGGNIAMDAGGNYVVVWTDNNSNSGDIYLQRYDASGVAQGSNVRVNATTANIQSEAQVAMDDNGNFVVVWQSVGQDGSGAGVYAQRYDAGGVAQGSEFRVNTVTLGNQSLPSVSMASDGSFAVSWTDDRSGNGDVYVQRFDASGVAQGSEIVVNSTTTNTQAYSSIAMDASGNMVVLWESDQSGDSDIFAQRYNASGVAQGSEFQVNTHTLSAQWNSVVAMADNGSFVVVWESEAQDAGGSAGIYAQLYNASGVAQGSEFRVNEVSSTNQTVPHVAMDASGRFIVTWKSDLQDGSDSGVYARLFDVDGTALGDEVLVNTTTLGIQSLPSVAHTNDQAVVTWYGNGPGDGDGVFTQRFSTLNRVVVAADSAVTTTQDAPVVIDPTANATDADTDAISLIEFTQPANGSVVDNGNGTLTYTPDAGYVGADSFEYVAIDAGSGLQHYFGLDGNATDLVSGANGTLNGTTTVAGDVGNGLSFNETTDYVSLPDISYNSEFSISFEFRVDETDGSLFQYLYSHGDISATNSINVFLNEAAHGTDPNVLRTVVRDANDTLDNTALEVDIAGLVGDGQFHTYTLTAGANGLEVFLDGVSVASDATRGVDGVDPTGNAILGSRQDLDSARMFGGVLDSVRIFDNALASSQVADLASNLNRGSVNIGVTAGPNAPTGLGGGIELNTDGGNDAYLIADDGGALLGGASELTMEVRFSTESTDRVQLFSYNGDDARDGLYLAIEPDGTMRIIIDGDFLPGISGIDYNTLRDGDIHSVALSWDSTNGNWAIYVDGALTDSGSGLATGGTLDGSAGVGELVFGQELDSLSGGFESSEIFAGTYYDVRIWNEVRSEPEIALQYQNRLDSGSLPTGLIANWQMDGFDGANQVVDVVSGNNLSLANVLPAPVIPIDAWTDQNGGASASGNTITFQDEGQTGWDSEVNSVPLSSLGFSDNYTVSFELDNLTNFGFVIGLGAAEAGGNFSDVDYSMYLDHNLPGMIAVYDEGNAAATVNVGYVAGDVFSFYVNGTTIEYQHNGVTFYTATGVTPGTDLYVDSAFYAAASSYANQNDYSLSNFTVRSGNAAIPDGYLSSTPTEDLHVSENAATGTSVGFVVPSDSNVVADIVNDGLFTEAPTPATIATYTPGQSIGDWTVSGSADVHLHNANGTYQDGTPLGGNTVHLGDDFDAEISQTLATEAGTQYQVVFAASGDWRSGGDKGVRVSAAGQTAEFIYDAAPGNFSFSDSIIWEPGSMTFTATGASTVLSFESIEDGLGRGVLLSDIRVIEIPAAVTEILNNDPTLSYDAATDKFYRFVNSPDGFDAALAGATGSSLNGVAGQLVTIDSAYENELIRQFALNSGNEIWIGARDTNNDGNWNWLDGSAESDEQFWAGGNAGSAAAGYFAPTFGQSQIAGEDYARMITDGTWADDTLGSNNAYVIEWDASEVLSNFTFALTDDAAGRFSIDNNSGEITVADGSLLDYEAATSHDITVQVTDASGNAFSEMRTIVVDNEQEPAQTVPGPQTVDTNEVLTFSAGNAVPNAVTVSDTLIGTDSPMQVQLSVNDGELNLSTLSGITVLNGAQGSSSITIAGLESDINAALEGMTFTPNASFNGSVSLEVSTSVAMAVAGLEGHYTFEGGAALDQSAGNIQNGTLTGGATTAIDPERGEVLSLPGNGASVDISGLFGEPANVTLAAWVNLTSADVNGADVISLGDSVLLRLQESGSNDISGYYYDGTAWNRVIFDVGSSLVGAGWRHVAFSFNDVDNTATLYLDGIEVSSASVTSSISYGLGANTVIGTHGGSSNGWDFNGLIDDARIYTRAISADEVAALAANRASTNDNVDISVTSINDAPVFSNLNGAPTYIEDGTPVVLDADVGILDEELTALDDFGGASLTLARASGASNDDIFSATGNLVFNAGTLELAAANVGSYTNTNGTLTLTFGAGVTNAQVNEIMRSLAYANSSEAPPASVQVDWTFSDGNAADAQGSGPALAATGSTTVAIIDVSNDASLVVPIAQSVNEDAPLIFSAADGNAIVLDSGNTNNPVIAVTLAVSNGSLTLGTTADITFVAGTNDGDATVMFYGTESAVNAALNGLQYQGAPDFNGSDTLTVTTGSSAATEATLYARYEFGNGAQIDQSGNGFDGTLVGDPTLTVDPERGDVMTFDGDDRIEIAGGVAGLGDQVTFSAWVNLDAGQQDAVFLSIGDEFFVTLDQSFSSYSMGVQARGFSTNNLNSANNIAGEGWNHVAATLNDTTNQLHLYLNGVLITSSSGAFDFGDIDWGSPSSPNITIGSMSDGSDAFVGSIDDVRVYTSELTQAEILGLLGDHGYATDAVAITVDAVNDAPVYTALPASNEAVIDESVSAPSVLASGDFDNDGHLDLIGATNGGQVLFYTNDGNGGFSSGSELFNTAGYDFRSIATGDLDGDGDLDVVVTNLSPDGSEDGILIFENQFAEAGSATFTMTSMESTSFDAYDVAIADIDGDTRLDIVASFQSGEVIVYEQNTADVFTRISAASVAGARGIDVGDIDGDGSLDIAVAGSAGVYWLENDSAANPSFTLQTALTLSDIADVKIEQLNAGTDADIAYLRDNFFGSQIGWLQSDGGVTPAFTQQVITPLQNFSTYSANLVAADIDNSGSTDLILGWTSADQAVIYSNDGSGTFTQDTTQSLTPDGPSWVEAADLDGDGDLELLYAQSGDSTFSLHVNRSAGVYTTINANEDTTLTGLQVQIDDVDAQSSDLSITLTVTNGVVTIPTGGVTFAGGINSGNSVAFTGTLTEINTALNSFSFTPDADYFGDASIAIAVNDLGNTGSGGAEVANETLLLHVQSVNDAPSFQGGVNAHSGPENATFTPFDTDIAIADNDSASFNGGALTISSGNPGPATDQLQILEQGGLTLTGNQVRISGVAIGTWAGGDNGTDLTVVFNVNADVNAVNQVLHSVRYNNTDDTPSSSPSITAFVTDGDGGASPVLNADITLVAENDAPTFISLDGTPTFVEDGAPVVLDANAQIFDAELSEGDDFNGATLVLARNGAPSADDVFSATGTLSALTEGANLVVGGTTIGTVSTNSAGTLALAFNGSATNALVNSAMRQIAYSNSSNLPPATIQINWTFDDGNAVDQGSGGALTASGSTTVSIQGSADLSITAPTTVATNEDTVLVYSGANVISVDDGIAVDTLTRVTLSVTNGSLTLADLTGITLVDGADGSSAMVIEGLKSDINSALDGLRFTPDSNYNGSSTLTIFTAIAGGLEGHYTFEGGNANDQSAGTAYDGTLSNDAVIVNDVERGDVLSLDGDGDTVTINSLFDSPASVTMASWINVQAYDEFGSAVMSLGENVLIWLDPSGVDAIRASYYDGTDWNEVEVAGASQPLIGTGWHHIAYTVDDAADTQTLYLNGQVIGQTNYTESISYTLPNTVTRIGGHAGTISGREFNGLIDDARVYTRALSGEEIAALATDQTEAITSVAITVDAVNDAPIVTAPGSAYSYTEQGSLNIHGTGFSVADIDDNGGMMTATFSVGEGRVLIDAGDSGVVLTSGNFVTSGNSTDTVTFTGTQAQINALLDGSSTGTIVYHHDQTALSDTPSASTTITLNLNDQGNTGADPGDTGDGSSEEHFATQTINIISVNDAPNLYGQNLISNGTFAAGLTDWTTTGEVRGTFEIATFGSSNAVGPHTLSQNIATSAGETYVLEFDSRDDHGNLNQQLEVTVDGASNLLTTEQILTDTDGAGFVRYRFTFTADSGSATVTFADTSDSAGSNSSTTRGVDGTIDNVSVRQSGGPLGSVAFTENGAAVILGGGVTLFDAEIDAGLDDYDGTTLTLARNGGPSSDDLFSGSGNLVFSAGTLELSSAGIGSYSYIGGQLVISFNDTANSAQINEVLQSIAYRNVNDAPPASVQIDWTFDDANAADAQGSGSSLTASGSTTVNITAVNDAPVLTVNPGGGTYYENTPGTYFDTALTISDGDSADFDGGQVTVSVSGSGEATDRLTIRDGGGVSVVASDVRYDFGSGPVVVGTVAGGAGHLDPLVITFNGQSDATSVQAIARQIAFSSVSDAPSAAQRALEMVVTDGDGGTSAAGQRTVNVIPVNDAVVLDLDADDSAASGLDYAAAWTEGAGAVLIGDSDASLVDLDNPNLQSITITITNLLDGADELLSANTAGTAIVASYDSINGVLTLSGDHSLAEYQQVLRTVTYDNSAGAPDETARTITFVANDGTDTSAVATTTLSMTGVNTAAVVSGDTSYTGAEGDAVGGNMDAADADGLNDGTVFSVTSAAANGNAAIDPATGVWTFTPTDPNWFGSDSFTVTITDDLGGTTEQVVNITLANVDDAAVITGDVSFNGDEGDVVGGDLNATDVDGLTDGTYFTVTAAAANGTAAIDPETGVWTFTPTDPNWNGTDSFTVTVTDDLGGTTEQ
ncbi:MAG: LamG-like jellyroll fold domain-containing protein, partial [Gammaproteobacteria bacterium]